MINNSITTFGQSAIGSAGVGTSNVLAGIIAFLSGIGDTITTHGQLAVESAASGLGVAVAGSIVANLTRVNTSISAFLLATAGAAIAIEDVSVVASFTTAGIDDSVSTFGNTAPGSASIRFVGVEHAVVAFFQGIKDTVTTSPEHAVGSAGIWN